MRAINLSVFLFWLFLYSVVWMGIFIFVSSGWEHTVANMFFLPLGLMLGAPSTFGECMYHNILPVTAGNFVGGMRDNMQ